MARYGIDLLTMDATYKTMKYALPLFFLCVRSNHHYQVVAVFITETELKKDIMEALAVIRAWNPNFNPTIGNTDYCLAEINAFEETWPGRKLEVN